MLETLRFSWSMANFPDIFLISPGDIEFPDISRSLRFLLIPRRTPYYTFYFFFYAEFWKVSINLRLTLFTAWVGDTKTHFCWFHIRIIHTQWAKIETWGMWNRWLFYDEKIKFFFAPFSLCFPPSLFSREFKSNFPRGDAPGALILFKFS